MDVAAIEVRVLILTLNCFHDVALVLSVATLTHSKFDSLSICENSKSYCASEQDLFLHLKIF